MKRLSLLLDAALTAGRREAAIRKRVEAASWRFEEKR